MDLRRRGLLALAGGALLMPALVRAGLAMPISAPPQDMAPRFPIPMVFTSMVPPKKPAIGDIWFQTRITEWRRETRLADVWRRENGVWVPR